MGNTYSWATVIACLILTLCVGLVVLGGIQRIAKVSQIIVPFMAVLYVALALIIVITNITAVPGAIATIVKTAFNGSALAGGAMGNHGRGNAEAYCPRYFLKRVCLGSAPIAAALLSDKGTGCQGLVSMTGTFIDTIVICTMTGLSIVITETWNTGLEGVAITTAAFQKGLPFPAQFASFASYAVPGILRIHNHPWMGLLLASAAWNTNCNMTAVKTHTAGYISSASSFRTVHDCCCCLEHCRYLQCPDGLPEPGLRCLLKRCSRKGNKGFL